MPRKITKEPQPSTSRANRKRHLESSEESASENGSDEDTTFRPSMTISTQPISGDLSTMANNMVKYMLNYSATKIPMKRADISRNVNIPTKIFPEVFKVCANKLQRVYGLAVTEICESKSSKVYIIYSAIDSGISALQFPPDQRNETTLLFLILSYIFMKGGEVQEGKIYIRSDHCDHTIGALSFSSSYSVPRTADN